MTAPNTTMEPTGAQRCPVCGGKFKTIELLAVHLIAAFGCRRGLIEQDRIQLMHKKDLCRRLVLTDSLYLTIHRTEGGSYYSKLWAVAVLGSLGELVRVDSFSTPNKARKDLRKRQEIPMESPRRGHLSLLSREGYT